MAHLSRRQIRTTAIVSGAAIVVAVGLVVWFFWSPVIRHPGDIAEGVSVPDIQATWSSPATLQPPAVGEVVSPVGVGVDGVVALQWWSASASALQAFDFSSMTTLWTDNTNVQSLSGDGAGSLLLDDGTGTLQQIDVSTGQVKQTLTDLSVDGSIVYADSSMVITAQKDSSALCGRRTSDLATCVWQMSVTPDGFGTVFGGGKWLNTANGVVDITTGQPAAFGSDASMGSEQSYPVLYDGPDSNDVFRFAYNSSDNDNGTTTFQKWSSTDQSSLGDAVTTPDIVFDDTSLPLLIVADGSDTNPTRSLTAYSWQTGGLVWQATVPPYDLPGLYSITGAIWVTDGPFGDATAPDQNCQQALDVDSGAQMWAGCGYTLVGSQGQVVYAVNGANLVALGAVAPNFTDLWSLPLPAADAEVYQIGGNVFAISQSTSQLWLLQS